MPLENKFLANLISFFSILYLVNIISCSPGASPTPPPTLSSEKKIISFAFKALDNPGLFIDVNAVITQDTIKAIFPCGSSLTSLTPTISFLGKNISPAGRVIQNFTNIVIYTVTAEDGTIKKYFILITTALPIINSQVSTFAGNGTPGLIDNFGEAARFSYPEGITIDFSGNLYIADQYNRSIRKITPSGLVSTIATFSNPASVPTGVTIDPSGNIYVADHGINIIRKISSSGVVSDLTSNGLFNYPTDVAVDASGNVFVTDAGNRRIRKVTPSGVVTTFAGSDTSQTYDGIGLASRFIVPRGITIDAAGNLYVTDYEKIRKITPAAVVSTIAGSSAGFADGPAFSAKFFNPKGITIDPAGNIFISDKTRIRKITTAGMVITIAGTGNYGFLNGAGCAAEFDYAEGIVVDASGNLFIADNLNNRIRKIIF